MITVDLTDAKYEAIIREAHEAGYNQAFAKIVKNCSICHNCNIYRDAWNVCFVASECLTKDFMFCKRRSGEVEENDI